MNFQQRLSVLLATGGGVGYVPWAPGTLGTVVGLPFCYGLAQLGLPAALIVILAFIGVASAIAGAAEHRMNQKDPGCIVIDEMAGMMVTLIGLPWNVPTVLAGFAVFRFFDILKPCPIRQLERRVSGGFGIVIDDVLAGVMANVVLRISSVMLAGFYR